MSKAPPVAVSPLERLAKRMCVAANARGLKDASAIIAEFKQRSDRTTIDNAVAFAVAKQWLRADGRTYVLTQAGLNLGTNSRAGQRTRRLTPF